MKKNLGNAALGAILVILSSFFYASYGIWTKLMGEFFGGYTASALRSVLVLLILVPFAFMLHKFEPLKLKKNWKYIAAMIFFSFFIWGPLYYAVLTAGVSLALTAAYASIVIGMLFFGWLMAGEQLTKTKWISAILGFVGLALIFTPSTSQVAWLGLAAAVLSGLSTAALTIVIKLIPYNATQTTVVAWVTSVIANTIMIFVVNETTPAIGWHVEYVYLLFFTIASIAASLSLNRGVKLIDAGIAGILGLLEIVFGIAFGMILFHEQPGTIALIGAMIIIAASAIPYLKSFKIKKTLRTAK